MEKFRELSMPVLIFSVWILSAATAAAMTGTPRFLMPEVSITCPAPRAHASR